ncbi:hypothetical protein CL614_07975 [archaeon]|nr:hypothetical protein [archaeon]
MSKDEKKIYALNDNVVSHIAKLLQLALITGTDIVDHMRMIRLEMPINGSDKLKLEKEYKKIFDGSINAMLSNANLKSDEINDDEKR